MNKGRVLLAAVLVAVSISATAQVPVALVPGIVGDAIESIGSIGDGNLPGAPGVFKKLITVPSHRTFYLSDLSLGTRLASTQNDPCIVEVWRGTETAPTALAWSRVKIASTSTYDRSWNSPPTFEQGEVVWIHAIFDPFNTGARACIRADPNRESQVTYALRGYLRKH